MADKMLEVKDLKVSFKTYSGEVQAVRGVSFYVNKGETLGIVGESGCGKSVTAKSINKLIPMPPGKILDGSIVFNDIDITDYGPKKMQKLRGKEISMIFQDPMSSLNPTKKVGKQISEGLLKHYKISKDEAKKRSIDMLHKVGLPNPDIRYKQYPHEYSGGMRQRAMIALAMVSNPKLLIADEPTTALDVTIQAQILRLMKEIQSYTDTSIIMITHDLGVIANIAHRVAVMYAGIIVETGTVDEIFFNARHPYTWGLLQSIPDSNSEKKGELSPIDGTPPDLFAPPKGCPFADRCKYRMKICKEYSPDEIMLTQTHSISCWLMDDRAPTVNTPIILERRP